MKNLFILTLLFPFFLSAQQWRGDNWGVQVGISADLGSHKIKFGYKLQGYYTYRFVQLNTGNLINFSGVGLGDRKNYITQRINLGLVVLGGKQSAIPQVVLDGLYHQTKYNYGLSYNYLWYIDNVGTSQTAGGFGLHIQQVSLLIENDLFSGTGRDRFRTSFVAINYHRDLYNITLNTLLWTGETWGVHKVKSAEYRYPGGFKDLRSLPYGKTSHGILSLSVSHQLFYGNQLSFAVGIDSEYIRDGLQNKLMHDKTFLPKKWRKENANYPMLDASGLPTHHKENVRPARLFIQAGLNSSLSY